MELTIDEINNLTKNNDVLMARNDAFVSALEKIKVYIANICEEECDYTQEKRCGDSDCRYGEILDIVKEVLK